MSNILLVEADKLLGDITSEALRRGGHQVYVAQSADQALQTLDDQSVDLIILDLQLPLHNGVEFLYDIRSYGDWQHKPVIIHSAIDRELFVTSPALHDLGVVTYLQKPYTSLAEICRAVEDLVH